MLFALGSNGAGQLNLGHTDDVDKPTECLLSNKQGSLVRIDGGGNHTFLRFEDRVYLVGVDEPLYLPESAIRSSLSGVLEFTNVQAFAATWDAFAVVTTDSENGNHSISTFGASDKGQLGRLDLTNPQHAPASHKIKLPFTADNEPVVSISGGVQHFVALLSSGQVVGWGNGRKGQLGEPSGIIEEPRVIADVDFKVRAIHCGREFTYLLGDPETGEHLILGSDKWQVKSQAPASVKNWKTAGASWGGISVLLDNGEVLSWGRNDHGQLAPSGLPSLRELAVGSEHTIALTQDGRILTWGWGEHGNCGELLDGKGDVNGRWNALQLPSSASMQTVNGLAAGCATSWIWTSDD